MAHQVTPVEFPAPVAVPIGVTEPGWPMPEPHSGAAGTLSYSVAVEQATWSAMVQIAMMEARFHKVVRNVKVTQVSRCGGVGERLEIEGAKLGLWIEGVGWHCEHGSRRGK